MCIKWSRRLHYLLTQKRFVNVLSQKPQKRLSTHFTTFGKTLNTRQRELCPGISASPIVGETFLMKLSHLCRRMRIGLEARDLRGGRGHPYHKVGQDTRFCNY
jgi:hypothetical protein